MTAKQHQPPPLNPIPRFDNKNGEQRRTDDNPSSHTVSSPPGRWIGRDPTCSQTCRFWPGRWALLPPTLRTLCEPTPLGTRPNIAGVPTLRATLSPAFPFRHTARRENRMRKVKANIGIGAGKHGSRKVKSKFGRPRAGEVPSSARVQGSCKPFSTQNPLPGRAKQRQW